MTRGYLWSIVGGFLLLGATASPSAAADFVVDSTYAWQGFMNVFELPENGQAYVFGSGWGPADLVSNFSGTTLTLAPNTIGDPSPFWYSPSGGPGAVGQKWMDANLYVEDNSLVGQSITFSGTVLTNTFVSPYSSNAFIRDFAPDYSSYETTFIDLQPGPFSITHQTIDSPGRHVQFGFNTSGPNVWVTDVAPFGNVTIAAVAPEGVTGDYNNNNTVDAADYTVWRDKFGGTETLPNDPVGGTIGTTQYDNWKANFGRTASGGAAVASVVPEPASCVMLLMVLGAVACGRRFQR